MYDESQIYFPAEDTFLLRDAALREVRPDDTVLEMGTGTGTVAAAIAPAAKSTLAADINPHAVAYAREVNGLNTVESDMFSQISGLFSLILFNAPYLPTTEEERGTDWLEYALDGGPDGRSAVSRFLKESRDHLEPDGRILLLVSSLTGLEEVESIATELGFRTETAAVEKEEDGEYLYVLRLSGAVRKSAEVQKR